MTSTEAFQNLTSSQLAVTGSQQPMKNDRLLTGNYCQLAGSRISKRATCRPSGILFAKVSADGGAFSWQFPLLYLLVQVSLLPILHLEAIWRCCDGPEAKAVPGMSGHVLMLLMEAIWRYCNGHEAMVAPGMNTRVSVLLVKAIWKCCNGHEAKAVPGMR